MFLCLNLFIIKVQGMTKPFQTIYSEIHVYTFSQTVVTRYSIHQRNTRNTNHDKSPNTQPEQRDFTVQQQKPREIRSTPSSLTLVDLFPVLPALSPPSSPFRRLCGLRRRQSAVEVGVHLQFELISYLNIHFSHHEPILILI